MKGMSHVDDFFGCGWIVGDTEGFQRGITLGFTGFDVDRRLVISICDGVQLAQCSGPTRTNMITIKTDLMLESKF